MAYLISIPILMVGLMLQLAIFSQLPLLSGIADLVLLILIAWSLQERSRSAWFWALVGGGLVSLVSAMPFGVPLIIYLAISLAIRLVNRRVLEFPVLGMLIATIVATFLEHLVEVIVLFITGTQLPLSQALILVTMPSALLNLILCLPVYALVTDLARWVYPVEVQI